MKGPRNGGKRYVNVERVKKLSLELIEVVATAV
jgi:hypothetical protein